MASIAYALSIQHFINSVGAKAGFASIIGLALLVLLFFTQSRETANLRRRADEAEQQLQQLQLYVDHLSRQRTQPAAAPAAAQTTGAPVAAPPAAALAARAASASYAVPGEKVSTGAVATIPAAPAGVGAPALSSATRLIPLAEPEEISIRALRPSTNGDGDGHVSDATVATPPPTPPPAGPAPSTAAGGGNGVARPPVVPMPTMAAATPAPAPRVALPRQQQRPPGRPPASPPPPRRRGREPSGRRISPVFLVLAGILLVAVVAVVLVFVTGSSNNSSSSSSSSASSPSSASSTTAGRKTKGANQRKAAVTTVTPSTVTVAVLNGTSTNNLAHDVSGKLTTAGYKGGPTPQNAAESGVTSTIVGYTAPGYRADALAVAKSLNLSPTSVQAISQGDRLKVCGSTTTCTTQVVVTAGANLATG